MSTFGTASLFLSLCSLSEKMLMTRSCVFAVILAAVALQAATSHAAILLDNTNNLQETFTKGVTGWSVNSPAYNRINGITIDVGSTSYDVTSVALGLSNLTGTSEINMRLQFWELPAFTSSPASNASPFYTEDYAITASAGSQYYTFAVASGAVNLKANTRYSLGVLSDLDNGLFEWGGHQPLRRHPLGCPGITLSLHLMGVLVLLLTVPKPSSKSQGMLPPCPSLPPGRWRLPA